MSELDDSNDYKGFFASLPCAAWLVRRDDWHSAHGNSQAAALLPGRDAVAVEALDGLFQFSGEGGQSIVQLVAAAFATAAVGRAAANVRHAAQGSAWNVCVWPLGSHAPPESVAVMAMPDAQRPVHTLPEQWSLRVGHDLRGPITPIRMAVQLLRSGRISPEEKDDTLRLIDRQVDRLLAEIDCTSDLLRIQAGSLQLNCEVADINVALDSISGRSQLARALGERGQRLETEPSEHAVMVEHDSRRLLQMLEFLLLAVSRQAPRGQVLRLALHADGRGPMLVMEGLPADGPDEGIGFVLASGSQSGACADTQQLMIRELLRLSGCELSWNVQYGRLCLRFDKPRARA